MRYFVGRNTPKDTEYEAESPNTYASAMRLLYQYIEANEPADKVRANAHRTLYLHSRAINRKEADAPMRFDLACNENDYFIKLVD